jgi:hypothetical protein
MAQMSRRSIEGGQIDRGIKHIVLTLRMGGIEANEVDPDMNC